MTRLTLYTRPGCHLCEDAVAALERIGEPYAEIDISGDRELEAEYGDRIPVIMLDGREHGYWRVEEQRLRRDLAKAV
ncbi:glutaredoxin family protein [Catellatospora vulcania]|uniref:glutaredoxin family protein n=1 Tax=Catellatospora vulcania TaxID=1460450 RepID=UPI0012D46439|nr:glutaredoxin family protein [Catellatospora vulcania]